MKEIAEKTLFTLRKLLLVSLLIASLTQGLYPASVSEAADNNESDIKLQAYAETCIEYTDNVFRLDDSQVSMLEANTPEDAVSGRFRDMESVSDFIVSPEVGLGLDSDGPLGGKLSMVSWLRYNHYSENRESSFPKVRIRLRNSLGEKGILMLEGDFLFDFFKKNYLSGVNDENANGNIPREERIYSPAIYDEYEGIIAYEQEIINNNDARLSGLSIGPFAGHRIRRYNSTFSNRDQDISWVGIEMDLEFISRIDLEMIYLYEDVAAPGNRELILFDETVSGTDINNDGEIKGNAQLFTVIDRSSSRHTIEINPSFKLTKDTRIFLGYEKRIAECASGNKLDIEHYNQEEYRRQIKSGIRHDFSNKWTAEAEYSRTNEEEEDGDYSENSFLVKIKYYF
ncbi:MAG: hypothetical protein JW944_08730 [Deltaproteobacteria bacterium]|nr:hypothetical protein [Deltaproteobacteria bacterium]